MKKLKNKYLLNNDVLISINYINSALGRGVSPFQSEEIFYYKLLIFN